MVPSKIIFCVIGEEKEREEKKTTENDAGDCNLFASSSVLEK